MPGPGQHSDDHRRRPATPHPARSSPADAGIPRSPPTSLSTGAIGKRTLVAPAPQGARSMAPHGQVPSAAPSGAKGEAEATRRPQPARAMHELFGRAELPAAIAAPARGSPLSDEVRTRMEHALGANLGDVRIHVGPEAL